MILRISYIPSEICFSSLLSIFAVAPASDGICYTRLAFSTGGISLESPRFCNIVPPSWNTLLLGKNKTPLESLPAKRSTINVHHDSWFHPYLSFKIMFISFHHSSITFRLNNSFPENRQLSESSASLPPDMSLIITAT